MAIEVTSFTRYEKNTLRGFLTIRMSAIGLEIRDLSLHEKNGKKWVQLPAKLVQRPADQGGNHWFAIVDFYDKGRRDQFQTAALEALDLFMRGGARDGF